MNYRRLCLSLLAVNAALLLPAYAQQPEPVLEQYTFGMGQNSDGISAALHDKSLGRGTAKVTIGFADVSPQRNSNLSKGTVVINVSRKVAKGHVVFALLCDRIEVRGSNAAGEQIYSSDLPGFTFGDSKGGNYHKTLRTLPLAVCTLQITFFGNYE